MPESRNTFAAYEGFCQLCVKVESFYGFGDVKAMQDLGPEVIVVGFICDTWDALDNLHLPWPPSLDYPEELRSYLGRELYQTTLNDVRGMTDRCFVKPVRLKKFCGFVWEALRQDRLRVATYEDSTPVWVSSLVDFKSEYRCFVQDGKIIDVRKYKGDWSLLPSRSVVEKAIQDFKSAPRAYALDWGVTDDGRTLLVEGNDGFSVGSYGLNSVEYVRLLEARWEELTSDITCHTGSGESV
jgi:hypothetical protein